MLRCRPQVCQPVHLCQQDHELGQLDVPTPRVEQQVRVGHHQLVLRVAHHLLSLKHTQREYDCKMHLPSALTRTHSDRMALKYMTIWSD